MSPRTLEKSGRADGHRLICIDGSINLSRDEALVLDAFFRRWQFPPPPGGLGKTLAICDEVERFRLINLSADIEGLAMDDLEGTGYDKRLEAARARLRAEHELPDG